MSLQRTVIFFGVLAVLSASAVSHAATLSWSAAQDTTSVADVSTNGTPVSAFNGGSASVTAGGVNFAAANPFGFATAGGFGVSGTGDADFDSLINSASFSFSGIGSPVNSGTIDLGAFTLGNTYEVQVFFADQRTGLVDRINRIGSFDTGGIGATVELESDPNNNPSAPFGQFAIGTFVADGDDPDLTVFGVNFNSAQVNAWQVREVVPEPATAGTVLLACGLAASARRRVVAGS